MQIIGASFSSSNLALVCREELESYIKLFRHFEESFHATKHLKKIANSSHDLKEYLELSLFIKHFLLTKSWRHKTKYS